MILSAHPVRNKADHLVGETVSTVPRLWDAGVVVWRVRSTLVGQPDLLYGVTVIVYGECDGVCCLLYTVQ